MSRRPQKRNLYHLFLTTASEGWPHPIRLYVQQMLFDYRFNGMLYNREGRAIYCRQIAKAETIDTTPIKRPTKKVI